MHVIMVRLFSKDYLSVCVWPAREPEKPCSSPTRKNLGWTRNSRTKCCFVEPEIRTGNTRSNPSSYTWFIPSNSMDARYHPYMTGWKAGLMNLWCRNLNKIQVGCCWHVAGGRRHEGRDILAPHLRCTTMTTVSSDRCPIESSTSQSCGRITGAGD